MVAGDGSNKNDKDMTFHFISYLCGELQAVEKEKQNKSLPKKWHSGIQMEEFQRTHSE